MLSTTINHVSTGTKYCMELFYWGEGDKYILRFTSTSVLRPRVEEHACDTFEEGFRRYCANCRVYEVEEPKPMDEFEFRGIPRDFVIPPKGDKYVR